MIYLLPFLEPGHLFAAYDFDRSTTLAADTTRAALTYAASSGSRNMAALGNTSKTPCPCPNRWSNIYYNPPTGTDPNYRLSGPFLRYTAVVGTASGGRIGPSGAAGRVGIRDEIP